MRYFLAVARGENIHRAAEVIHVSPGSLSKAIRRLEDELGKKLFRREGRNIKLTPAGKQLRASASEIIRLEESSRLAIAGAKGEINIVIVGSEILLCQWAVEWTGKIKKRYPKATFEYRARGDEEVICEVARGESHIGFTTQVPPSGMESKIVTEVNFVTCVGTGHPLYLGAKSGKTIPVEKVLVHGFAIPTHSVLGNFGASRALDGWREDKFPRRVEYRSCSLKLIEELVLSGRAIAYLPDYLVVRMGATPVKLSGCHYYCRQTVRMIGRV